MNKIPGKNITEVCEEIDLIIAGRDNRFDYKYIYLNLNDALARKISYGEIVLVCETIVKIATTKNKTIRHLEKDFWSFFTKVPFQIILTQGMDIGENEDLLPNMDYDNVSKKTLARLAGLAVEILELKIDKSKGSALRRAGSLSMLGEMINYYHIPVAKSLFMNSIKSKSKEEQYAALEGLENYYDVTDDEIEDDLVKTLYDIKNETDERTVASTCLQIQINAGIIDEMSALFEIDDWKYKHYKSRT